ncbi:hypothetical protein A2154_03455 [Candidatus Gottesmanbacteria bacterium RBG_16_43_7]|uniref:Sortase n=1 Tax=Candidatus Gottesmanbacteria bacterium RBG_16_43_7 TaxID=1798373 RepID=A0A1F5ZAU9_9BACT|nr:MAG: hypothetical protein A2154_03455 [Candidatus Gottesmanbacteria bacterium RBG_16_43_7]
MVYTKKLKKSSKRNNRKKPPVQSAKRLGNYSALFVLAVLMCFGAGYKLFAPRFIRLDIQQKVSQAVSVDSKPVSLYFRAQMRKIPVTTGSIANGKWYIADSSATYLDSSATPGSPGNIVIYGHNKPTVFGILAQLGVGDEITVIARSGSIYRYSVMSTSVVEPEDISVAFPTRREILTLYTCTGLFDTKRLVIVASPIKYQYLSI